ncbi:MAG: CpaF family protein [Lachnospiraceae bacterium]
MNVYMEERKQNIKRVVQERLLERPDLTEEEVKAVIDDCIIRDSKSHYLSLEQKKQIRRELFNAMKRLDVLQDFIEDDSVTEIMVNGINGIFIERNGRLENSGKCFESKERLQDMIQQIAAGANRTVNMSSPIVDARLPDGARVNIVLEPAAIDGPILTIRRFSDKTIDAKMLLEFGSVSCECLSFLQKLVEAGYNILISGGTGAGKTTFLNVLSGFIPKEERVITIEDSAELKIQGISNLVRLEARSKNANGCREITIRDLIRTALRMRPDRIVVGEVRGEEAIDMLQALNIGQDGSLSTIHANSAQDALSRLETMIMLHTEIPLAALRRQIASGIDLIVHLGRLRDKSRRLLEIRELCGLNGNEIETELLYQFEEQKELEGEVYGEIVKRRALIRTQKLKRAGIAYEV